MSLMDIRENISAIYTEGYLASSYQKQKEAMQQLSTGERINSSADDAAGLALVDGLRADNAALTQSQMNVTEGVGLIQVADGVLAQITTLLNRAITLATEASNGSLNSDQVSASNKEYQQILHEIDEAGSNTSYNTIKVFSGDPAGIDIFADFGANNDLNENVVFDKLASNSVGLGGGIDLSVTDLASQADAQATLPQIVKAVASVAAQRGYLGARSNALSATHAVLAANSANMSTAQNTVDATDVGEAVANMSKYSILCQSAISALAQCNNTKKQVASLLDR